MVLLLALLLTLQGQPAGSAIGGIVVVAGTNTPIPHAHVTVSGRQPIQTETDDSGRFEVHGLEPGRYQVIAQRDGYVAGQYGRHSGVGPGNAIELAPQQAVNNVLVGLIPKGAIFGRVSDANGNPVANARVQALRYTYMDGRRILVLANNATSDDRGDYAFMSMTPGAYVVSALPRDAATHLPVYFPGTTDVSAASTIDLPPGLNFTGVDLRLIEARPVRISGQVMNSLTGQAAADAAITLVPRRGTASTGSIQRGIVSATGAFEFQHMAAGSYDIVASLANGGNRVAAAVPIDIGSADIDNVNLILQPQFTVTGKISIENQAVPVIDLSRVRVELRHQPFTAELLVVLPNIARDGTFALAGVTPGEYELRVNAGSTAYVKTARFGAVDALNPPFHIDAGAGKLDIVLSLNTGMLDAVAVDDKQKPVPDATVVLVPEPPFRNRIDLYDVTGTDTTGRAHLTGIAPGDYRIFAWDDIPADAWQDPDFIRPYESRGKLIHVFEGQSDSVQLDLISRP